MRINTNISSLIAYESNSNTNYKIKNSLEKLSSGFKINKASDDASALAIADKLRTQATSINQGIDNGNSAVALLQIADKSMAEQSNILDIVKAKLIQANTDTTSDDGREAIRKDINKLLVQLDNIAIQTNYNGRQLISNTDGIASASSMSFQIGEKASDIISSLSIQANTTGLPPKISGSSTTGISVSETITPGNTITFNNNDENFDLTLVGSAASLRLLGTAGLLNNSGSDSFVTVHAGTSEYNALINAGLSDQGGGNFNIPSGTSLDLTGINLSYFHLGIGSQISLSNWDLSSIEGTGVVNIAISGTKDNVVNSQENLLGLKNMGVNALTKEQSISYQSVVDSAITKLNGYRAEIGSTQNQVESAVRNLMTQATNVKVAESIIRDVDYSVESSNFNKQNIIAQAGSYALSQANNSQQNVLRLLT